MNAYEGLLLGWTLGVAPMIAFLAVGSSFVTRRHGRYGWRVDYEQHSIIFDSYEDMQAWMDLPTRGRTHWASLMYPDGPDYRAVTVTFEHPRDGQRSITVSKFSCRVDNLWAIQIGLDAIRFNEQRGLDDVVREFYQALPAPAPVAKRDPYEVLGIRPDAPREIADAAYRALAKSMHSDVGGDDERMKELNAAYEEVKAR